MAQLSSLDLLLLSEREQQVVRCLAMQPGMMVAEIAQRLQLPIDDLEETLARMVREARLVERLQNGQRTFSVHFRQAQGRVRQRSGGLRDLFESSSD